MNGIPRGHRDRNIDPKRDRWTDCGETYNNPRDVGMCEQMQAVVDARWQKDDAQDRAAVQQSLREMIKRARNGRPLAGGRVYLKDTLANRRARRVQAQQMGQAAAQVNIRRAQLPRGQNPRQVAQQVARAAQQLQQQRARANRRQILNQRRAEQRRNAAAARIQALARGRRARQQVQQQRAERMADGFIG